jgi:hypothetical protein
VASEIGAALLNGAIEFVCTDLLDPSEKFAKSLHSSSTKSVQADSSIQVKITMTHEEIAEIPGNRHEWGAILGAVSFNSLPQRTVSAATFSKSVTIAISTVP